MSHPPEPADQALPPPVDMDALAAFNPSLASGALAQLYADGRVELALAHAAELDPFENATLRASAPGGFRYDSLFGLIAKARDLPSLNALAACSAEIGEHIFSKNWETLARMVAEELKADPDSPFAQSVFPRLDPPQRAANAAHRAASPSTAAGALAMAALKAGKPEWLARIHELSERAEGCSLPGCQLLRERCLAPFYQEGALAVLALPGALSESSTLHFAQDWAKDADAAPKALGLAVGAARLEKELAKAWEKRSEVDKLSAPDLGARVFFASRLGRDLAAEALFLIPTQTPVEWLGIYLAAGVDPFAARADSQPHPAARLLGEDWRSAHARRWDKPAPTDPIRDQDDKLLPLLGAMIEAAPTGASERFELSLVEEGTQTIFKHARKVDALALCAAQGFYRCADLLVAHGADWKFAAKQCAAGLGQPTHEHPKDAQAVACSYFEAISLRAVSLKSSARRDAKPPPPDAPAPSRPRL